MELVLEGCLWLARRITGGPVDSPAYAGWRDREHARGALALALFFFLLVGVPILIVLWGYATGRLPAPSPYVD